MARRPLFALLSMAILWPMSGSPAPAPVPLVRAQAELGMTVAASVTEPAPGSPVAAQSPLVATDARAAIWRSPVPGSAPAAIDPVVLDAYRLAATTAPSSCHLEVSLLAAIGQVESGNLAGYRLDQRHRATPVALGPVLDGSGDVRAIADTDGGQLDGNVTWDRAIGPMQFLPSTWRVAGVDLDADGQREPQDIEDAAGAAMVYLCAFGRDLSTSAGLTVAVLAYNHSAAYLRLVLAWKHAYDVYGLQLAVLPARRLVAPPVPRPAGSAHTTGHVGKVSRPASSNALPSAPGPAPATSPAPASQPDAASTLATSASAPPVASTRAAGPAAPGSGASATGGSAKNPTSAPSGARGDARKFPDREAPPSCAERRFTASATAAGATTPEASRDPAQDLSEPVEVADPSTSASEPTGPCNLRGSRGVQSPPLRDALPPLPVASRH